MLRPGALTPVLTLTLLLTQLTATPAAARAAEVLTLADAVGRVPVVPEDPAGYSRDAFRHWNAGTRPGDGCDTRGEVLIAEAVKAPTTGPGCALTGGTWLSYYDGQEVTDPADLAVDHMVPLAEAWASGASSWNAARREAYANDQGASTTLVAVTARTHRDRAGRDPADWIPPATDQRCRYVAEWVTTKLRWQLDADTAEMEALKVFAEGPCEDALVQYRPAP
ncbi:DUF1524 domain-containing protein [Streptomyces sp. NPDC015127]|uniref:GmrSD restriction endonuclease domain-containing protein n=1 Tax=Streptomyces sp. NPDC015127 TaxID=3364939 RepID=UPI0036F71B6F